ARPVSTVIVDSERGSGEISAMAGAADPMITTFAVDPLVPVADSALGVPFRAESAANGDTELDRAGVKGSVRRASTAVVKRGMVAGRAAVVAPGAASLSNCSIGSRR